MKMKKATSWLLSIAMILSMLPATAFAAEADNLCEHHAEHTAECGYVEGVSDCAYHCDVCLGHDHGDEVTEEDTEPAPVCDCGTDDAAIHATTCAVYEAPENPVCFCAEKCSDTNIWCDVCGFGYTACGGSDTAALYEDTTYPYAVVDTEAGTVTIDGTLGGKTEAEESDITALLEAIKGYVDSGITTIIVTGSNAAMIEVGSFIMPAVSEALYRLTNETSDSPYCGTIDLILPDVTEIVDSEFDNTFALNSITLHKVTTVGDGAFYATKYLKKLTFGSVITFVNEKSRGPFHMDGYEVGGCDLVLNCGQLQAEEKYKPNLETNVWFIGDWSGEYEWKSITPTHTEGTAATCNAQATCSVCGDSYGEVDADAHSYGDWVSNGDGTHTRTCANDSNHTENGDCSGGTATCTEQAVCDICKTAYGALGGHTPAEDATYTDNSDGTHSYTCSSCGNPVTESHTFTDGACTGCGVIGGYCGEEGNEQNVIWTYANGTLTISGTGAIADQRDNYDNRPWEEYVDQITTIVVNDGITSIGEAAFWRFQKLTTAKLPDSLTTISQQAFYGCTALKTVNFPANLKTIEGWAFLGCALESVTLPEGLTTIGYRAFSECKTLTSVTVPASVTTIDEGAFGYSPAKITVAEDNLNYSSDEHGVLFDKDKTTLIYCRPNIEVETYTIPSTVTEICKEAFYGCKNLATITIPDGVQKIGSSAFGGCEALTTITIPAGVTTIEANTFYDCTALTAVTIPAGVTTIDMWAFSGCTALTTVTIPASVTSIAYNAFSNCSAFTTVNVPCTWDGSLYTFDEGVTVNKVHNWTNGTCTVCGEPCDHKDSTHTTATNNGNGTHSFTCTVCLTTFTENHTMDDATGLCDSGCGKMMAEASVTKSVAGGIIGSGATTYYETLGEAIQTVSNCTAGDYATVKLLSNLMLTETITISSGVFTLDLNEKNVVFSETATIGFEISGGKVTFAGNGTVTKEDGTVTVVNTDAVVTISGGIYDGAVALANAGTVTVSGGTLKGSGFGIRNTGDLTIAGGEVSPYQKNTSNPYNVTAIISSGGRITVTGGTLKEGRFGMIMYQDGTIDLVGFREAKDVTIWRDDLSTVEMNASDVMLPEGFGLFDKSGTQQTGSIAEGTMLTVKQLHVHDWTYTADGNTITATCNAEGCSDAEQSIMISAVGKTYDGTPVTATLDGSIDGVTVSANDITYSGNTNADTYTASITIEGKTASVEFVIAKANQEAPNLSKTDETLKGQKNGTITGVTNKMEYATTSGGSYTAITGTTLDNLAAGTYYVRFAADANHNASPDAEMTIAAGAAITVTYNQGAQTASGMPAQLTDLSYGTKLTKPANPTATNTDFAFIGWYKDAECTTEWNFSTDTLTAENVTLYAKWKQVHFTVTAVIKDHTGANYYKTVAVKLMCGNDEMDSVTGSNGTLTFSKHVDAGMYNLVATYTDGTGEHTKTELIHVDHDGSYMLQLPAPGVNSYLDVSSNAETPAVMVGGLDAEAADVKEDADNAASGGAPIKEVSVTMDVEGKKEAQVNDEIVQKIEEAIAGSSGTEVSAVVEYLEIAVKKEVVTDSGKTITPITETTNVIEIVIPFNFSGKGDIKIIRHHGDAAAALLENNSKGDGTFYLDRENGYIHIFTKMFSTYAVSYTTRYNVTFDMNGGDGRNNTAPTKADGTVTLPSDPTRSGYTFKGWYTASSGGTKVTSDYVFSGDTTVYARWTQNYSGGGGGYVPSTYSITVEDSTNGTVKADRTRTSSGTTVTLTVTPDTGYTLETLTVTTSSGKEIDLTNKGDGKYTFKMPSSKVTVKATFMDDNTMLNFFVDVPADAYYYDAVLWAAKNGITSGTTVTTFSPNNPCTRAQMATFLWRTAGSPEPVGESNPFTDVRADAYYAKAIQWAYEKGITGGTSGTTFSPDQTCTRGQMATFLWRNAGSQTPVSNANQFADVPADKYYATAVQWAYEQKITSGTSSTTFSPDDPCTRAQMVTFLYRFFVG